MILNPVTLTRKINMLFIYLFIPSVYQFSALCQFLGLIQVINTGMLYPFPVLKRTEYIRVQSERHKRDWYTMKDPIPYSQKLGHQQRQFTYLFTKTVYLFVVDSWNTSPHSNRNSDLCHHLRKRRSTFFINMKGKWDTSVVGIFKQSTLQTQYVLMLTPTRISLCIQRRAWW